MLELGVLLLLAPEHLNNLGVTFSLFGVAVATTLIVTRLTEKKGAKKMSRQVRHIFVSLAFSFALITNAWATGLWYAAGQNTAGWQFMAPDERIEHQRRMRSLKTYEECKIYQDEHHARMAERALREGVVLERKEKSGCEQLRQRGKLN